MSFLDTEDGRLYPQGRVLQDEVVLSQAWKKTQAYIRRHNWYADTLELDVSSICLDSHIAIWAQEISSGKYTTRPTLLVPAPKSGLWGFHSPDGWTPRVKKDEDLVLRPLAHVGIREQTVATAVMLCLADCVESVQGDTSLPYEQAARNHVYSYGNRLFCQWSEDHVRARFSWGNSNTYSRYFQDYQRFVERPVAMANAAEAGGAQNVAIVSLDLSAFFDNVDIDLLVNKLEDEYEQYNSANGGGKTANLAFWKVARQSLRFQWREDEQHRARFLKDKKLPSGLPQGLVASGFFANAYLLDFDRAIGIAMRKRTSKQKFRVHDYCRYVDDLRLVVSTDEENFDDQSLAKGVEQWVQKLLTKHTTLFDRPDSSLRLNLNKTQIERLGEVGGESRTTVRMKTLQSQLSGPFDLDALRHVETGLHGLLSLAELSLIEADETPDNRLPIGLASVARTKVEVRDDTLTRFSAFRLALSLRMRRGLTDFSELDEGDSKEGLSQDFEAAARRLISSWATNPSLVQVLRFALDIFPSAELLQPVADALLSKVHDRGLEDTYEKLVAYYVLSELFKAGSFETGKAAEEDKDFSVADVNRYREVLAQTADKVLETKNAPWYVQQQASLFLLVTQRRAHLRGSFEELRLHRSLLAYVARQKYVPGHSPLEDVAVSLIGHQITGEVAHYVSWFIQFSRLHSSSEVANAWRAIASGDRKLFDHLLKSNSAQLRATLK